MGRSITLTDDDVAVLEQLAEGGADVDELAAVVERDREELADRLAELADNGLVRRDDGVWTLTGNGRRALAAPGDGSADQRIDAPEAVDAAIDALDLRADREEAVRNAFGFLRLWGEATESEMIDGVYTENPAGFESEEAWWAFVADRLASLPGVAAPGDDGPWRYEGEPTDDGIDGRQVLDVDAPTSAKHAFAEQGLSREEGEAAAAALAVLQKRGTATERDVTRAVYDDHPAGYDSPEAWWDGFLRGALRAVPAVVDENAEHWRYRGVDAEDGEAE